jgi:predicted ATPase
VTSTPLVGRSEEIDQVMRQWEQAKQGKGRVVLVSGEPGIGKSRLIQTVLEHLSGEPHACLRFFCSPHHQDSALYPTITQLERAAGFQRGDTTEQRLNKLEEMISQATKEPGDIVPHLAALLSISTGHRYPTPDLSLQKQKEATLGSLMAQVERLVKTQPVLVVWEDVHWSDPTSLEFLDLTIDRVPSFSLLLIVTYRPEFVPHWIGRSHVIPLTLNRLLPQYRAEMISHVAGGQDAAQGDIRSDHRSHRWRAFIYRGTD